MGKRLRTPEEEEVRDMDLRKHSPAVGTEPKAKHSDSSDMTGPNLPGSRAGVSTGALPASPSQSQKSLPLIPSDYRLWD